MKKPMKDRVGDFMAGKGFYIVLFLCVAAIGISGYYLFSTMSANPGPDAAVAGQAHITVTPTPPATLMPEHPVTASVPRATAAPTPAAAASGAPVSTTPAPTAAPEPSAPVSLVFTWPIKGEILSPFSVETLAYDVTMGDWRTHAGIDIAAEQGVDIRATAAGTVSAVEEDALMGTTVIIDHGDGVSSVYSNLDNAPAVEIGDTVYTGDFIGKVGNTAISESALPSHLHFAVMKNDLPSDPLDYLPGRT